MLKRISPVWVGVILVSLVRSIVALCRLDDFSFQYYTGNLAWAVLQGLPLVDPLQLPLIPHNRGSMVVGFLAIPFLKLFGPTVLALKVMALTGTACTAAVFVHLLNRHVGTVAAWCGVLTFAFLPPAYLMVDVLMLGSHVDTVLVTFGALAFLINWRTGIRAEGFESSPTSPLKAWLFGLICGFGFFFSLQFLVAFPALILAWWLVDKGCWKPNRSFPFLIGLILACLPIFHFLPEAGMAGDVIGKPLEDRLLAKSVPYSLRKGASAIFILMPRCWLFDPFAGAWARIFQSAAIVAGLLLLARRLRRTRNPFLAYVLLYPFLIIPAYAISDFEMKFDNPLRGMGSRYFLPVMPALAAWVPVGVQSLWDAGRKNLGFGLVALTTAAGVAGLIGLLDFNRIGRQPSFRGTEFSLFKEHVERAARLELDGYLETELMPELELEAEQVECLMAWRDSEWIERTQTDLGQLLQLELSSEQVARIDELLGAELGVQLQWTDKLDPDWPGFRPLRYTAIRHGSDHKSWSTFEQFKAELALALEAEEELRAYLLVDLGRWMSKREEFFSRLGELREWMPPTDQAWLMRGVGQGWVKAAAWQALGRNKSGTSPAMMRLSALPPELGTFAAEGMGFWYGDQLTIYYKKMRESLMAQLPIPSPHGRAFFRGMGWGYRMRYAEHGYWEPGLLDVESHFRPEQSAAFHEGLAWGSKP